MMGWDKVTSEEEEEYNRKRYVRAMGDAMETFSEITEDLEDG